MNLKMLLKPCGRRILAAALALLASGFVRAAETPPPKFFSIVFLVRDGDYSQPPGHWANPEVNFDGLKTAFAMLDKAYEATAGPGAKFPAVIGLETVPSRPEYVAYIKDRLAAGSELAVARAENLEAIAKSLGVNPDFVVTQIGAWESASPESTARDVAAGFRTRFQAVLEGDSLINETIDNGHNWEGRPFFPYYVQFRPDQPLLSAKANRELRATNAPLELMWLTRSPWSEYDRFCFMYSFHLGDTLIGDNKRCPPGDIWFWRNEVQEWEKNLAAGRIPYAHLSICNESCCTTPLCRNIGLDLPLGQHERLGMLVKFLLERGWQPVTGKQFQEWYAAKWPSPDAPNQLILFNDTARQPDGRYFTAAFDKSVATVDQGQILIAETKHFRVIDHQHRLSPFMEVAYDLEAPNLHTGGYTAHDQRPKEQREANHAGQTFTDGTGRVGDPDALSVTAATGNALFWGNDPHRGVTTKWEKLGPDLGVPADASRNRDYTLLVDGKDIQFAPAHDPAKFYGEFFDLKRTDESVSWKKRIHFDLGGKSVPLVMAHTLIGTEHQIELIDESGALAGHKLELAFRPFWYPAWLKDQERLAFGTASGMTGESFAYRVDNDKDAEQWQEFPTNVTQPFVTLYHCDPLRPEMARSVRVEFPQGMAGGAKFMDPAGSWIWTEARVPLKTLGKFTLKYNRMFPLGAAASDQTK